MSNQKNRYEIFPYKKLSDAFMAEANQLIFASSLTVFPQILDYLSDYPKFLRSLRKQRSPLIPLLEASNNTCIIDQTCLTPFISKAIYTAHLAACCQMLMDIRLPVNQLQPETLKSLAQQSMPLEKDITDNDSIRRTEILATMDAIRTIHILRALGLVNRSSEKMQQISFGAGSGKNDIDSIHRMPELKFENINSEKNVTFKVKQNIVGDIILVDADPIQYDHYKALNENKQTSVSTYNMDAIETLKQLASENIIKRNLVALLRMEHRMLPNAEISLHYLGKIINNDCDFILSIGSGDSIEDFEGRVNKVEEFYNLFKKAKLNPVILKLHKPGALDNQWSSLAFGHPSLATYQILYCKIDKKSLQNTFR